MAATLTANAVKGCKDGSLVNEPITLKVSSLHKEEDTKKWSCTFSDGKDAIRGYLASQVARDMTEGRLSLSDGDYVTLGAYVTNNIKGELKLIASELAVVVTAAGPTVKMEDASNPQTPLAKGTNGTAPATDAKENQHTNVMRPTATPGPALTPSDEPRPTPMALSPLGAPTPPAPTPPAGAKLPLRESRPNVCPIQALNPYESSWTIKAKVMHKQPLRTFNKNGRESKVFSVELADEQGSQIQGNFWGAAADKYSEALQEGRVYYFSKFGVRPANKQYATLKADYEITFEQRTEVEECADQSGINITTTLDLVPLEKLPTYVGRKTNIDVQGVVASVGSHGTVKRKADNTELPRRDVTIVDQSARSVVLTLWNDNANNPQLDNAEGQVIQVTSVRVGDYNGCSISSLSRSIVTFNPDTAEARELQEWWEAQGRTASITPLGQPGGATGGGAAGTAAGKLAFLSDVQVTTDLPAPDAKPTYHNVVASLTFINPESQLFYLANPENGRKVVPQDDGRFWCEGDSKAIDTAQHRYLLKAKVTDCTGECWVNIFNQQAEKMLGMSADALAALKDGEDDSAIRSVIKGAQWNSWVMALSSKSREYQGERHMSYTVAQVQPMDFVAQSRRLLQLIQTQG